MTDITVICNDVEEHFPDIDHMPSQIVEVFERNPDAVLVCSICLQIEYSRQFN